MPDEAREELLSAANAAVKTAAWGTRLSHVAVYSKANLLDVTLKFDDSQPINVWRIMQPDGDEFKFASLHQVDYYLDSRSNLEV